MKRFTIIIGLLFVSLCVLAQNKGDMYLLTSVNVTFGNMSSYEVHNNQPSHISQRPMNTDLGLGIGFGYFVLNGFRLELGVSGYYIQSPREEVSYTWLNNIEKGIIISPNVSYFFKLADRLYYAPEIGASFDFGQYTYWETPYTSTSFPYRGYSLYANLLAFKFKVSQRFSLGVLAGDVQYNHLKYYYLEEPFFANKSFRFRWNSGSIYACFYF